jgi:hypothetical protein
VSRRSSASVGPELMVEWWAHPTARAVEAILMERGRHPELADALFARVFDPPGRFTAAVLQSYARLGQLDARLVTPVVEDIGEALVVKHGIDTGALPPPERLAEIVDQAILPSVGVAPPGG